MKSILNAVVRGRMIVLFISFVITAFGIYSYSVIPKQENPHIKITAAVITTIYPGASPEDVEQLVTKKIEDAVSEISEYDYVSSESGKNVSVVVVAYRDDADIDKANRELKDKMDEIKDELPDDCYEPEINTDLAEVAGVLISLSGDNYTYEQLSFYAEDIKDVIGEVDGIYKTELVGEVDKQVTVKVDTGQLNQFGLSLSEVSQMLYSQNLEMPNGALENEKGKTYVTTEALYQSVDDIRDVIVDVSGQTGALVRLKDIAAVDMELEDDVKKCKQGEKNAVVIAGYFKDGKNIIPIGKKVRRALEDAKMNLPPDLNLNEVTFQPDDVEKSTRNFISNLIMGMVLVIAVIFLGMGLRNALVISLSIPLTIAITFILMNTTGVRIESMSLTGLIIALGMLVDNAVVVNDAIEVRIAAGESETDAAVNATSAVAAPVFTSTLTTVAAFFPLLFIPGDVGQFISSMPKTVIYALTASFISAIFAVPALLSMIKKRKEKQPGRKAHLTKIKEGFMHLLKLALKKRMATIGAVVILLVFTIGVIIPQLKVAFFPKADKDVMYIDTYVEKVGDLKRTEEIADRISRLMLEEPEVLSITAGVGTSMPKFYLTMDILHDQDNRTRAILKSDLSKTDRFKTKNELAVYLQEKLNSQIVGASSTVKMMELTDPENASVGIRLYGEDLNRLKEVSEQFENMLSNIPGTINVNSNASESTYKYAVEVDRNKAAILGMLNVDIQKEIQTALLGNKATVYRKSGKEYDIYVKSDIVNVHELENLAIKSSITGKKALLKQMADIKLKPEIDNIKRYKKERSIVVTCDVKPGYSAVDVENIIENEKLAVVNLEGVKLVFEGERENIGQNFSNLGVLGIFILFFLFIILLIEFKSFIEPMIILATVPLSLIGSMIGLLVFGKPLSFTALLGVVSLMGIVVNNAILLIDYIKEAEKEGVSNEEACINAVSMRFRPIMLTTVTTLMGLAPLAFSNSELFSPMAVALMNGLVLSTMLTMIVIPVIYVSVDNVKQKIRHIFYISIT
ncbi:efflux RND transporter permease subunit [Petroclostridium sp. X23]|uniref:efflux RND transporter permease subunit n=1 Tax=Petroclostridium sp. X23 TaxID=3045146 RepID=UPI0024AE52AF|nr:efflux RND transporter permease subunit [Petroclostridium sp. X23]WHH58739.1 efflux RND transporter permease subunit [Petroclostridium sp. X23]